MQSGLEKLFSYVMSSGFKTSEKWSEHIGKLVKAEEEFFALVKGDERLKEVYKEITDALDGVIFEESKSYFMNGFRLLFV